MMKLKEFDIKLDIKKSTQLPHFEVVVGDYDSNVLSISLYDNDVAYPLDGLDVEIAFAKPDRTTVVQDKTNGVVIDGDSIRCTLASNTIAKSGTVFAEVRVLQGTKVLTSPRFRFYVRNPILNDKTVASSNEYPMLVQALEDAKGAAESLPEINSAIDNIRNAESELNQSIGQASALDDTLNGTIQSAEQVKDTLYGSIESAGTAKTQLDGSISSASTSKSELDNSIAQAGTAKNELDGSIAQAGTVKGELDSSIATAGQTKTALDESIATGELAEFKDNFTSLLSDYASYRDSNNLKVAKVEKELTDYQSTLAQVNINQEATQTATGYGMVSLPKNAANGQVSVSLKGNTYTNILGNAGDIEDLSLWSLTTSSSGGTTALDTTKKMFGNNSLKFAMSGGNIWRWREVNNLDSNKFYELSAYMFIESYNSNVARINITDIGGFNNGIASDVDYTKLNQWQRLKVKFTGRSSVRVGLNARDNNTVYFDGAMLREITQEEFNDVNNITPNYINGTKSTVSASRLKSVGKNKFKMPTKMSDFTKFINPISVNYDGEKVTFVGGSNYSYYGKNIKLKPNTVYRVSVDGYGDAGIYKRIDFNEDKISIGYISLQSTRGIVYKTITTKGTGIVEIIFYPTATTAGNMHVYSLQIEEGTVATSYEPYTESTQYIQAKDEEGKIAELRSLDNDVNDEVRVSDGKLVKRVSDVWNTWEYEWSNSSLGETVDFWSIQLYNQPQTPNFIIVDNGSFYMINYPNNRFITNTSHNTLNGYGVVFRPNDGRIFIKIPKAEIDGDIDNEKAKQWLEDNQVSLIYQLAEPIEIPIEVSGTLLSYPSGMVYAEQATADAGVYDTGITVLRTDLPIHELETITKVDYETGMEIELDTTIAEIATDGLSFTHPELINGDIVFFTYEYEVESTEPEIEVEYYDSRYVVPDTENGKFYQWNVTATNGTPSIELVEV